MLKKETNMWVLYALLSAVFAALVSILAKIGLKGINSNLATAIRTFVVLLMAWSIVFLTGKHKEITTLTSKNWRFLIYSGIATGASWLFYFRALQMGEVSKVAPIDKLSVVFTMILAFMFLGETVTPKAILGGALIAAGTLVMVL
jgi:transporter family protein